MLAIQKFSYNINSLILAVPDGFGKEVVMPELTVSHLIDAGRRSDGHCALQTQLPEVFILESRLILGILDPRRRVDASPHDK